MFDFITGFVRMFYILDIPVCVKSQIFWALQLLFYV